MPDNQDTPSDWRVLVSAVVKLEDGDEAPKVRKTFTKVAAVSVGLGSAAFSLAWAIEQGAQWLKDGKSPLKDTATSVACWFGALPWQGWVLIPLSGAVVGSWVAATYLVMQQERQARKAFATWAGHMDEQFDAAKDDRDTAHTHREEMRQLAKQMSDTAVEESKHSRLLTLENLDLLKEQKAILVAHNAALLCDPRMPTDAERAHISDAMFRTDLRVLIAQGQLLPRSIVPGINAYSHETWVVKVIREICPKLIAHEPFLQQVNAVNLDNPDWEAHSHTVLMALHELLHKLDRTAKRKEFAREGQPEKRS